PGRLPPATAPTASPSSPSCLRCMCQTTRPPSRADRARILRRLAIVSPFPSASVPAHTDLGATMPRISLIASLALVLAATVPAACANDDPGPIAVYGNKQTFEIAPVLLAAEDHYPGEATVRMGSLANLVGAPPVPGFGEEGEADVATN